MAALQPRSQAVPLHRGGPRLVTTHVSAWFGRGRRPANLARQCDPGDLRVALTCEVTGCARPNHARECVVTTAGAGAAVAIGAKPQETRSARVFPDRPRPASRRREGQQRDARDPRGGREHGGTHRLYLDARKASIPWEAPGPLPTETMCKDTASGPLKIPLHPAAERYWHEAGYL